MYFWVLWFLHPALHRVKHAKKEEKSFDSTLLPDCFSILHGRMKIVSDSRWSWLLFGGPIPWLGCRCREANGYSEPYRNTSRLKGENCIHLKFSLFNQIIILWKCDCNAYLFFTVIRVIMLPFLWLYLIFCWGICL